MAVSIKDVASRASVSTATVSHVLNGTRTTRPHTKERVLQAVKDLGYARNHAARDLARGKSSILGLMVSDICNPFFPEIMAAFQEQALEHDLDAIMLNTNYDARRTLDSVRRLVSLQAPGVAILTSQIDPSIVEILAERRVAAVYLDLGTVAPGVSNIALDYEDGIRQALEHLAELGHRRIGYVSGPDFLASVGRRKQAFIEHTRRLGLTGELAADGDFTVRGSYDACSPLLSGPRRATAVVAGNDMTAIAVLHRAYDTRLLVPDELSVVGFDDIVFAEYTQPALTTVALPRAEIGKVAFKALWAMLGNAELTGSEYRIGPHLVKRGSTAAAKQS